MNTKSPQPSTDEQAVRSIFTASAAKPSEAQLANAARDAAAAPTNARKPWRLPRVPPTLQWLAASALMVWGLTSLIATAPESPVLTQAANAPVDSAWDESMPELDVFSDESVFALDVFDEIVDNDPEIQDIDAFYESVFESS